MKAVTVYGEKGVVLETMGEYGDMLEDVEVKQILKMVSTNYYSICCELAVVYNNATGKYFECSYSDMDDDTMFDVYIDATNDVGKEILRICKLENL